MAKDRMSTVVTLTFVDSSKRTYLVKGSEEEVRVSIVQRVNAQQPFMYMVQDNGKISLINMNTVMYINTKGIGENSNDYKKLRITLDKEEQGKNE